MAEVFLVDIWIATKHKWEKEEGKQNAHLGEWKNSNHSSCFYFVVQMDSYENYYVCDHV